MEISTKFNVGSQAFFLHNNKVVCFPITSIQVKANKYRTEIEYTFITSVAATSLDQYKHETRVEDKIFKTRQDLADFIAEGE